MLFFWHWTCRYANRGQFSSLYNAWKINFKGRSASRFALDPNVAAALLHDAVHSRQAQAGSLGAFGGEKGFENVRLGFRVHTEACVADGEHHVFPRPDSAIESCVVVIQSDIGSFNL